LYSLFLSFQDNFFVTLVTYIPLFQALSVLEPAKVIVLS